MAIQQRDTRGALKVVVLTGGSTPERNVALGGAVRVAEPRGVVGVRRIVLHRRGKLVGEKYPPPRRVQRVAHGAPRGQLERRDHRRVPVLRARGQTTIIHLEVVRAPVERERPGVLQIVRHAAARAARAAAAGRGEDGVGRKRAADAPGCAHEPHARLVGQQRRHRLKLAPRVVAQHAREPLVVRRHRRAVAEAAAGSGRML